jgi:SAM-dependent methyltransferase
MKAFRRAIVVGALLTTACSAAPPPPPAASRPAPQHDEGTRPLFQASDLGLLESDDRDRWQRVDEILDDLNISDESTVADIAAGGGWFSDRLSRRVGPKGVVFAEEIQQTMIEAIRRRIQVENLGNIRPILGTPTDPHLPSPVDAVVIINSFHDIEDPVPLLRNLRAALNRRGLIGIVDFTPGGGGPGPDAERVTPEAIIAAAKAADLRLIGQYQLPPFEFLLAFGK